jgi:hypothetical protein
VHLRFSDMAAAFWVPKLVFLLLHKPCDPISQNRSPEKGRAHTIKHTLGSLMTLGDMSGPH